MKFIKTPVKGMCDMLPADMRLREHVLGMIKETYGACGFMQIETPVMEHIENLTSKQGGDNEKLIFKVMKRGAELQRALDKGDGELADNGLRYDLTVPLARYYANNKEKLPTPFKAMQLGNVWRADNPQKGRFRQFTQCDIDILGDDSSLAEIELITATATMLSKILAEANLNAFTIHINDRRMLAAAALTAGFEQEEIAGALISLDKFDKIGMDGIEKDLLESGYAPEKVEKYMAFYRSVKPGMEIADFCAGVNGEYLEARVGEALADIVGCVQPMLGEGVKIVFDPTLVRGMGYYTGTIFEIKSDDFKGSSIAGGGRYDNMIGSFTGTPTCACGFSIGFERLVGALLDKKFRAEGGREKVAVLYGKAFAAADVAALQCRCNALRESGKIVLCQRMNKNLGFQKQKLEAQGYTVFVDVRTPEEAADKLADRT